MRGDREEGAVGFSQGQSLEVRVNIRCLHHNLNRCQHTQLQTVIVKRPKANAKPEEVGQAISELSRELSTNQIAPFSHRVLK